MSPKHGRSRQAVMSAPVRDARRLIRFFAQPASYPHPADAVQRRETHVSQVFLAGAFAYKVKKPVHFPFLDASTLAFRKKWCRLETSLNRRLAPNLYLGVVPVVETPRGLRLGGKGRVVEWAVKMRRLPEERMLDQCLARRQVSRRAMTAVADVLFRFFRRAARRKAIDRYGAPRQVEALVLGNLRECEPFVGRLLPEADRALLEEAYRQFLVLQEPLLARRVQEGRVIDGHGDLRCENICMTSPVTIFDCVEFQPAFRCGDLVNDFSFLIMDLELRGRRDLADALVARYRRTMRDPTCDVVLPFYQCHRSLVRGKVRGLAWLQHPHSPEGRRVRALSRRHFRLAVEYARRFSKPRLIAVGGMIGTGKSTLARSLARAFGAAWLRTDEIRLREFADRRRPDQGFAAGLYAPQVSEQVYQRLMQRAEAVVARGRSVVCDGMFAKQAGREALRRIAARHHASFHFFECVAPKGTALHRMSRRLAARTDLSEARPDHYERLLAEFEPAQGRRPSWWTRLATTAAPERVCQTAVATLRRAWVSSA